MGFSFSDDCRLSLMEWWNVINQSSAFILCRHAILDLVWWNVFPHLAWLVSIRGQNVSEGSGCRPRRWYHGGSVKWKHLGSAVSPSVLHPLLARSPWTVNGVRCIVGAAAIQTDYACHCWSTWNGRPLRKWSQAAYKCTLYKQSTGGQSAPDRYLMETSGVYCRLHGERWIAAWTAAKCSQTHTHTHTNKPERHTHACASTHTQGTHMESQSR